MTDKMSRGLSELQLKVDVDVSEALTGLKALQREAKKATQALKETEVATVNANRLRESLYDDLSAVLAKFKGVENTEENRRRLATEMFHEIYGFKVGASE